MLYVSDLAAPLCLPHCCLLAGARLLTLGEDEMAIDMLVSRSKIHKVQVLQRAVALFDRIATLQDQGRVSEVELRLYLAGHGASTSEVNKVRLG